MGNCTPEHSGSPYLPPCNGWGNRKSGPCFNHKKRSETTVPLYLNTTQVANYKCANEGGGGLITPYPKMVDIYSIGCGTGGNHPYTSEPPYPPLNDARRAATYCQSGHQTHANPPCASVNAGWNLDQASADREFNLGAESSLCLDMNSYVRDPSLGLVDLSNCHKTGFKNAQARKEWYGRWGFTHDDPYSSLVCNATIGGVSHTVTPREGPFSSPDQTKHRMVEVTLTTGISDHYTYNVHDELPTVPADCPEVTCLPSAGYPSLCVGHTETPTTINRSALIDRYSGKITYGDNGTAGTTAEEGYIGEVDGITTAAMASAWSTLVSTAFDDTTFTALYGDTTSESGEPAGYPTATVGYYMLKYIATGLPFLTSSIDLVNGVMETRYYDGSGYPTTVDRYQWSATSATRTHHVYSMWLDLPDLVLGQDHFGYCVELETEEGAPIYHVPSHVAGWTATATLSVPYYANVQSDPTKANVKADMVTLLGYCDLTNDKVYPWRTDTFTTVAPLLSYNGYPGARAEYAGSVGQVDTEASIYDGRVLGKLFDLGWPMFLSGQGGGAFDPRHQTYQPAPVTGGGYKRPGAPSVAAPAAPWTQPTQPCPTRQPNGPTTSLPARSCMAHG